MVDPTDKNKIALALLEAGDKINLRVRKHPPPHGFMVKQNVKIEITFLSFLTMFLFCTLGSTVIKERRRTTWNAYQRRHRQSWKSIG